MNEEGRQLRAGRDYLPWPQLKLGHAIRLQHKLINDYQVWRASFSTETRVEYSEDRRTVTFYVAVDYLPPLYEWSLTFGDIIHNYRSALDALAWSMAHLDGRSPKNEREVYFPLEKSRTAFDNAMKKKLSSVPEFVIQRMQKVQPYHGGSPELAIGTMLHVLDIQDKHRSAVEIQAVALEESHYMVEHSFEDGLNTSHVDFEIVWEAPGQPITDGNTFAVLSFSHPVREARIPELPIRFLVEYKGEMHDVFELLHLIEVQVTSTFEMIETGLPSDLLD